MNHSITRQESLWSRECGLRDVLALGLPLVVSTSSFAFMYFCDRLFLTWYSTLDMAAVMQASSLSWSTVSFPLGIATYSMAFVAQYRGAGQSSRVGAVFWQASRIAVYSLPLIILVAILAPALFYAFGHEEGLVIRETLYFRILACGLPGMVLAMAMNSFFIGLERPRIVMIIDVMAALINVALDYALIFGPGVFPEWGLAGAGWATVVSIWIKVVAYALLMFCQPDRADFALAAGYRPDWPLLGRLLKFGVPNGLQFLLEGATFTVVLMFLGKLGPLVMGATTLAISVNLVAFVPMIGIGMAVTTIVGNQLGRRRPDLAQRATWGGLGIAMVYSGLFALAYLLVPNWLLFFHDLEAGDPELLSWSIFFLKFVAAFCVFDALQIIFASAIKGAGDTMFAVQTMAVTTFVLILVGVLGEGWWHGSAAIAIWWWSLLTGFLLVLALSFGGRFFQGKWKSMLVIETPEATNTVRPSDDDVANDSGSYNRGAGIDSSLDVTDQLFV